MLAYAPSSSPSYNYAPTVPSPLSPRSANIYGSFRHHYNHMNNDEHHTKATKIESEETTSRQNVTSRNAILSKTPFSKRPIKRAPMPTSQNSRRNAYLRKVSTQREDCRFETRGEDMMRLDFMQRQRAWEAERASEAPPATPEVEEEDYNLPTASMMPEAEVEEFLKDEGEELQALLEHMPLDEAMKEDDDFDEASLWSDDADYDALFSEVLSQVQQEQERAGHDNRTVVQSSQIMPRTRQRGTDGDDEMDIS